MKKTLVVTANAREADHYIRENGLDDGMHQAVTAVHQLEGLGREHWRVVVLRRAVLRRDYWEIEDILKRIETIGVEVIWK